MAGPDPQQVHATATKLAQLVGDAQVHAAPLVAAAHHRAGYEALESFLEDLEKHTSRSITPFLQAVLETADVPDMIRPILEEAIETPAQFSAIVTQLFLYGIVSQLLSASVQPFIQGVSNDLWTKAVDSGIYVPAGGAVIATAVARGLNRGDPPTTTVPEWAYTEAAKLGIDPKDLDLQASIVGTPPSPQDLFELLRRGIIQPDDVKTGMREGDTRDDWIDRFAQLSHTWLSPLDFVRAAVQQQMPYADARSWAEKTGLDVSAALPINVGSTGATPDMFGLAYSTAGRPPGPQELARMTLRGIINKEGTGADALTFQQGIAESDIKTKWTDVLYQLAQYVPPPEAIGTLLTRGAIDNDTAVTLWEQDGVPEYLAKGYAFVAEQQHFEQEKLDAKGEILTGYYDHIFTADDAKEMLAALGYVGDVADHLLAIVDFRREIQAVNLIVRKIGTLYQGFKISAVNAKTALTNVGIPDDQASTLLGIWEQLRIAPVKLPTVSEIGAAVKYETLTQAQALDELAALGYQGRDAQIVLSAHAEAQVGPLSPAGTGVTG